VDFTEINQKICALEKCLENAATVQVDEPLHVGVDLGTAYIVVVVLNRGKAPVACAMEFSHTVKDGLVVDYGGAIQTVKRLVNRIETQLGRTLERAAIAVPSGTGKANAKTHCYVVEGAGLAVTSVLDEPVAANAVLNIDNGVIVDIGGGTTGLAVIEDGQVVYTADEATGGTHVSLVLAGNYRISIEEAEALKKQQHRQQDVLAVVRPVIQKMATIVGRHIKNKRPEALFLVGGTCCMTGIEQVFAEELNLPVYKPENPFLVTPLGIALNCTLQENN